MNPSDEYRPGLEGVVATETAISFLDVDHEEIVIRGYDLIALARHLDYLSVAHLLIEGCLPSPGENASFTKGILGHQIWEGPIENVLRNLAPDGHLMDFLRTGLSCLATYDPDLDDHSTDATLRQALRLLGQIPMIVANSYHIKHQQPSILPDPELGYSANFLYMITGRKPTIQESQAFDQLLTVYSEHEMPNSTFAAIVIASTLTDLYGALVGATASLKGPLHGGANEAVMRMVLDMETTDQVEPWLLAKLTAKERIMGFGHRVYMHQPDPRAVLMKELFQQLVHTPEQENLFDMFTRGEMVMQREKGLYPNLDYYAAPVYYLLGIPIELYTPIFFAARSAGLIAHIREQYAHNRLFRPRVRYTGARHLQLD
ncbi:MAG: citrate synthase [Sulfobacillus sp.]